MVLFLMIAMSLTPQAMQAWSNPSLAAPGPKARETPAPRILVKNNEKKHTWKQAEHYRLKHFIFGVVSYCEPRNRKKICSRVGGPRRTPRIPLNVSLHLEIN
jgi:hypothetical protein